MGQFAAKRPANALAEFRAHWKAQQKESARARGAWRPTALPWAELCQRMGRPPQVVGEFAPRGDWDEAQVMPELWGAPALPRALPRISNHESDAELNGEMIFRAHDATPSQLQLQLNRFGIAEPLASAEILNPDFLFVPALGLDQRGYRVGRGGGYYDRYLSTHPGCFAVAVIHDDYLCPELPSDLLQPHDRQVAGWVTNTRYGFVDSNSISGGSSL